mgnify:CR=1 FL=1
MFGYVRTYKPELKLKYIYRYNELYCSLCYAIRKNYGLLYSSLLNYDITFLVLLLNGFKEDQKNYDFRCPLNPFKHRTVNVSESTLHYAAFINYYLVYLKVNDDILDDNSLWKKLIAYILVHNKKYTANFEKYREEADKMKMEMQNIFLSENKDTHFDQVTNLFGNFFAEIFLDFLDDTIDESLRKSVRTICFNLGKWIYIIDAYDDYKKDQKNNQFNLLDHIHLNDTEDKETQIHSRIRMIFNMIVNNMVGAAKELPEFEGKDIVENIITFGCVSEYNKVIKKRYSLLNDQEEKSVCPNQK